MLLLKNISKYYRNMEKKSLNYSDIEQLFFRKQLVELTKVLPKTPIKQKIKNSQFELTPSSKAILDSTSPRSKPYVLELLQKNSETIELKEKLDENTDPDYLEKMENNGLGFFMEDFISVYSKCPVCGKNTLKKYSHSNVPVVDLVCTNTDYHLKYNKCFLFQVKISLSTNYFNLRNQTIAVGSKTFGELAHLHTGTEPIKDKYIVPGYICIQLRLDKDEIQTYLIDHRNSFILVPDYDSNLTQLYYEYSEKKSIYGKDIIRWNSNMVHTIKLSEIIKPIKIRIEYFDEEIINNPYRNLVI